MTTQIAIRLDAAQLAALDAEVADARLCARDAVRRTIARLQRGQHYRADEAVSIDLVRHGESIYVDLEGIVHTRRPPIDCGEPSRSSSSTSAGRR